MLGNGFDLYHKLPTTYLCFLKTVEYLKDNNNNNLVIWSIFNNIKDECKAINDSFNEYSEFYNGYFFDDEDKEKIEEIRKLSKNNCWLNYFRKAYSKDVGWIDFEKEIAKVINIFSIKGFSKNVFGARDNTAEENSILGSFWFYCDLVPETVEDASGNISRHIIPTHLEPKEEYLIEYPSNSGNVILNTSLIIEKLYKELRNLAKMLKIYLDIFVEKPLLKMKDEGIINTNSLFYYFDSVITFNYTNTYEILYKIPNIHYIHGKLDENIVLGINPDKYDETDYLDTSYIMFKKYYQRVLYRTDNSFIEMVNDIKKHRSSNKHGLNNLYVCGHSLDITDQDIIKETFDISNNIFIICHDLNIIGNYVSNLIQIYGKKEFDKIRSEKQLKFITYDEWRDEQLTRAFVEGFSKNR